MLYLTAISLIYLLNISLNMKDMIYMKSTKSWFIIIKNLRNMVKKCRLASDLFNYSYGKMKL